MRRIAVAVAAIVSLSGNFTRTAPARQEAGRQDGGVRMIAIDGEGAKYWTRWRGPSGPAAACGRAAP